MGIESGGVIFSVKVLKDPRNETGGPAVEICKAGASRSPQASATLEGRLIDGGIEGGDEPGDFRIAVKGLQNTGGQVLTIGKFCGLGIGKKALGVFKLVEIATGIKNGT